MKDLQQINELERYSRLNEVLAALDALQNNEDIAEYLYKRVEELDT